MQMEKWREKTEYEIFRAFFFESRRSGHLEKNGNTKKRNLKSH